MIVTFVINPYRRGLYMREPLFQRPSVDSMSCSRRRLVVHHLRVYLPSVVGASIVVGVPCGASATEVPTSAQEHAQTTHAPGESESATTSKLVWPRPELFRLHPTRNMVELGLYTGVFIPTNSHELYNYNEPWQAYRPGVSVGMRGGFYPLRFLGVEAEVGVMPVRTELGERATLYTVRGHGVFQLPLFSVVPFALVGGGMVGTGGSLGTDIDQAVHFGGGVKVYAHHWFGVRVSGRGVAMPARTVAGGYTVHSEVMFSFVVTLNRRKRDSDNDGVPDPGQRANRDDLCPLTPGLKALRGCPDFDRDGVADREDLCPRQAGSKQRDGCPGLVDTDGDGFFNPRQHEIPEGKEDRCPTQPGVPEYNGCPVPDTDGDSFDDLHDACAEKPETFNGFEDEDGCPDQVPGNLRKVLGTIQGIQFGFLSANLTEDSKPVIASAAKILADYPELRVEVQGHTDSDGDAAFNQELSRKRAEVVRQELIKLGLKEEQVVAVGYGGGQPVASNENEAGRAANRRIEFRLLDKGGQALDLEESK